MRIAILPYAIILTKDHRAAVSIMANSDNDIHGVLWPEYCL